MQETSVQVTDGKEAKEKIAVPIPEMRPVFTGKSPETVWFRFLHLKLGRDGRKILVGYGVVKLS